MPVMITQGDENEVVFQMPDTIDLESDDVSISIDMDDIDHFALWNPEDEQVTLLPYEQVEPGLYRVTVVLSDGDATKGYELYIYVFEGVYEEDIEEEEFFDPSSEDVEEPDTQKRADEQTELAKTEKGESSEAHAQIN